MKIVYVAGKFRGETPWEVHRNVVQAEAAALDVARAGAMPLCPHKNTEHFDGMLTNEFWLAGTMELLRRCDAVYVFDPGHTETSSGTRAEVDEARRRGLPVFLDLDTLSEWVRSGI